MARGQKGGSNTVDSPGPLKYHLSYHHTSGPCLWQGSQITFLKLL